VIFTATGGTGYNFLVGGLSVQNGALATFTTNSLTNGQTIAVIVTNTNGCTATSANNKYCQFNSGTDAYKLRYRQQLLLRNSVTFTASGGRIIISGRRVSVQNGLLTAYTSTSLTNGQVVDVIVSNTNGCTATSTGITNSVFDSPIANAGTGVIIVVLHFISMVLYCWYWNLVKSKWFRKCDI